MPPKPNVHVPALELNDQIVSDDEDNHLQDAIDDATPVAYRDKETLKFQTRLDKLEDKIMKPMNSTYIATAAGFYAANAPAIKAVTSAVDTKSIENGINAFAVGSKVLMKALDGIAQVHPFIGVAVIAFKAVITLELQRRENDQKIIAIKLKINDMMSILLELRNLKDPTHAAPDGTTVQGRMQSLMQQIAADITECGNACDIYAKKNILVKVLKSPIWEGRLTNFVTIFEQHRASILFALSVHTSLGVDTANRTLAGVHQTVESTDEKLTMLLLFRKLDSPREKELMKVIAAKGGANACLNDDVALEELMAFRNPGSRGTKPSTSADLAALDQMKKEMKEDVGDSLRKNMELFRRKLEVQKRQLLQEIEGVVSREGDRIISALAGPLNDIIDSDLHALWKEMGWKGSVKARHFVLALHDYFHEKYGGTRDADGSYHLRSASPAPSETESEDVKDFNLSLTTAFANNHNKRRADDHWALAYIDLLRVQSILEAFDDDASGFISIKEVNNFSSTRPPSWTLTDWLGYWAAGWHCSIWDYRGKIKSIIKTMFSTLEEVLPVNRSLVDKYFGDNVLHRVDLLMRSVTTHEGRGDSDLREKMQPYVAEEEERLRSTLESIAWDIDTMDTLALITGPGRIEKFIFPLLYLILHRHLRIIRLACTEVLDDFELDYAAEALNFIFCAADDRIARLSAVFKNSNRDVSTQLGNVAFGMLQFLHSPHLAKKPDENTEFVPEYTDDSLNQTDTSILKYGAQGDEFYRAVYDDTTMVVASAGSSMMKGIWTGLYLYPDIVRTDGLMQINIHTSSEDGSKFEGGGIDGRDTFTISGNIKPSTETEMEVRFVKDYARLWSSHKVSWIYHGSFDIATGTMSGQWGNEELGDFGTFRLQQAPAWTHQFRYSQSEFEENAALARWSFAGRAALYQAKQQLWSWSFFEDRRRKRKRFLELFKCRELTNVWYFTQEFQLTEEQVKELHDLEKALTPTDARLYRAIGKSEIRKLCVHFDTYCDGCSTTLVGPRTICLLCSTENCDDQVNLCVKCCIDVPVRVRGFTHSPLHDMVQVRRVVHNRALGSLATSAKEAVDRGKFAIGRSKQLEGADVDVDPKWYCSCCDDPIYMPCWVCMTCAKETFICDACNTANAACDEEGHVDAHPLIRLNKSAAAEGSAIESRLLSLETRFKEDWQVMSERVGHLGERLEAHENVIHDRLRALETMVEERLATVEGLLSIIVSKLTS